MAHHISLECCPSQCMFSEQKKTLSNGNTPNFFIGMMRYIYIKMAASGDDLSICQNYGKQNLFVQHLYRDESGLSNKMLPNVCI